MNPERPVRGRSRPPAGDPHTLPLFALQDEAASLPTPAPAGDGPPAEPAPATVLQTLADWVAAGWLRPLDLALARFLLAHDPQAPPALGLLAAWLSCLEGQGHTCLVLEPALLEGSAASRAEAWGAQLGWPAAARPGLGALLAQAPQAEGAHWLRTLARSRCVAVEGAGAQKGTERPEAPEASARTGGLAGAGGTPPLVWVPPGPQGPGRLYLRRYWQHEQAVAAALQARCAAADAGPGAPSAPALARVRHWLDRFFPAPPAGPDPADAEPDWQKLACAVAWRGRLGVITGGPGTGKTYTAARLLALLLATAPDPSRLRVALAAPTGKAAARLKQAIDTALAELERQMEGEQAPDLRLLTARIGPARTLHALLGARPDSRQFRHDALHPLPLDVLIVDEASMIHLEMMSALLVALPPQARLILLGDRDQLASVEAGAVMGDLCRDAAQGRYRQETAAFAAAATGQRLPPVWGDEAGPDLAQQTVMLRRSRRFEGAIGQLALAVNAGEATRARAVLRQGSAGPQPPLALREPAMPAAVAALALHGRPGALEPGGGGGYRPYVDLLGQMPAGAAGLSAYEAWVKSVLRAFDRFRVLTAVREGEWGVAGLNRLIAQHLASALGPTTGFRPEGGWYVGRPVMVTRNDAALGVFNGDIGLTLPAGPAAGQGAHRLKVWLLEGEQLRSVAASRLAHVETAYAMTVHKSQGSEFAHTVLVLPPGGGAVAGRELVYTGITRARTAFTLVAAQAGTLEEALARPTRRASGLAAALAFKASA
ncbi:exodeoxyribonuclease V subunit alpha [Ideonella livida]|uniref:RecBCD enzyme subunit RecD n=1 Tax=Ideonella livida TaxID=2707176 RepID=A0A7C9TL97_9BURK|nr:exodeoxyribonuclease V subunit alpha [Ideonella livida]NDY92123.1 exodeoxyribonuclease V subunit alpha [Ideonella livida]